MLSRGLLMVVMMAGCGLPGAPVKGQPCMQGDEPECMTAASVGVCDTGKWFEQPCANRCSNTQTPRCEWAKPKIGEPCLRESEGGYACASPSGLVVCREGKYADSGRDCPNCRYENFNFQCF